MRLSATSPTLSSESIEFFTDSCTVQVNSKYVILFFIKFKNGVEISKKKKIYFLYFGIKILVIE